MNSHPPTGAARSVLDPSLTPVPSPCINVCQMHIGKGWCAGCLRTLEEIAQWGRWGDEPKRAVWAQLPARRQEWDRLYPPAQPVKPAEQP